ncbi:MAG: rhomboid family intramembrane serine protease [Bacteroidales bacterium]|nr:rhomboid family intramembrane serine protease [Bacteroidales bacterium]
MSKVEQKKILYSLVYPSIFILTLWAVKIIEIVFNLDLGILGIFPHKLSGLVGIITSPFIHGDLKHLFANSVPLFVLGGCMFYFYREIAVGSVIFIYLTTGLWVWLGGREAYHIGASGIVYGLASFLFFSGILRKDARLLAITLVVTFLYGSMVWGIFPDFYQERNISFESHLWGIVSGLIIAAYFRKEGPQRKKYDWEEEDDEDDEISAYYTTNTTFNSDNNHKDNTD